MTKFPRSKISIEVREERWRSGSLQSPGLFSGVINQVCEAALDPGSQGLRVLGFRGPGVAYRRSVLRPRAYRRSFGRSRRTKSLPRGGRRGVARRRVARSGRSGRESRFWPVESGAVPARLPRRARRGISARFSTTWQVCFFSPTFWRFCHKICATKKKVLRILYT